MRRRHFLATRVAASLLPRLNDAQPAREVGRMRWLTAQRASTLAPFLRADGVLE